MRTRIWHSDWKPRWLIRCVSAALLSFMDKQEVFWWHIKLQPHVDRIYFLYDPPSAESPLPEQGRIVVGLFKNHCVLP